MKSKIVKLFLVLLAMIMILSSFCVVSNAAVFDVFAAGGASVVLDGTNSGTATVSIVGTNPQQIYSVEGNWDTTDQEGTNNLTLSSIGSDVITFGGMNYADAASGKVLWQDANFVGVSTDSGVKLLTATYTVAADTPAGEYTVRFRSDVMTGSDYNPDTTVTYFTAKITVTRATVPTEYEITWKNESGSELYKEEVAEGATPEFKNDNYITVPTGHSLVFTPAITAVTADTTYTVSVNLCVDQNKDHVCDLGCGASISHTDTNIDHKCDIGGEDMVCSSGYLNLMDGQSETCNEAGYKAYYKCSCGKYYEDADAQTLIGDDSALTTWKAEGGNGYISATGHSFTNYESDNNATCTEDGTKTAYCDNGCGETDTVTDEGSATGNHSFTTKAALDRIASTANCQSPALYYVQCDKCDAVDTSKTVSINNILDPNTHYGHKEYDYAKNTDSQHWKKSICYCGWTLSTVAEDHDYTTGTTEHTCACGAAETFEVNYNVKYGNGVVTLGNTTAVYGQEFTTTLTAPEGAHLGMVYCNGGLTEYTYENGTLTIAAENVTGAITISVRLYVEITIDANGGTFTETNSLVWEAPYNVETEIYVEKQPRKTGHKIASFNTSAGGEGDEYTLDGSYIFTEDMTLYTQWNARTYTIIWYVDDNNDYTTYQVYGAGMILPEEIPVSTEEGYEFDGWFTKKEGGEQINAGDAFLEASGETIYYAQWKLKTYTITWKLGDDTVATQTVEHGGAITEPEVTVPAKYYGYGWTTEIPETATSDLTIEGYWTARLEILDEEGNAMQFTTGGLSYYPQLKIVKVGEDGYANYRGTNSKVGHTLYLVNVNDATEKYEITYSSGATVYPSVPMTENKTLQLVAEKNTYTITWKIGDKTIEETYTFGDSVTAPSMALVDGKCIAYYVIGWKDIEGNEADVPTTMPGQDMTFVALYTEKTVHTGEIVYTDLKNGTHSAAYDCCGAVVKEWEYHNSEDPCVCGAARHKITVDLSNAVIRTFSGDYDVLENYAWVYDNNRVLVIVEPADNYILDTSCVTVTINGVNCDKVDVYQLVAGGLQVTIPAECVTGDGTLTVTAKATYTLEIYAQGFSGDEDPLNSLVEVTVPYGALLKDYIPENCGEKYGFAPIYAPGTKIPVSGTRYDGTYTVGAWCDADWNELDLETATMPANDFSITNYSTFTGWKNIYWDRANLEWSDTALGVIYQVDSYELEGWQNIDGSWYYFAYDEQQYYNFRVEDLTRVPYPTETINGITYAPDQDALDYCESKGENFKDATEAWFIFGEDGKFQNTVTGMGTYNGATRYAENGMLTWHPGLIKIDDAYYYFIGDVTNGGNIMATGDVYVTDANDIEGFVEGGIYTFGTDGKLCKYDGITEMADGTLRYYDDYRLMAGAGLIKIDNDYYYVKTNGELVVNGEYWVTNNNGITEIPVGNYKFDENGKLLNKNGVFAEDGGLFYYENGYRTYKGLIKFTDGVNYNDVYIYVRSNGQLATGRYWITRTNSLEKAGFYEFDEKGIMQVQKNGIVEENGKLYYYVEGSISYSAGLIQYNDGATYNNAWIYVRSNGQLVTDTKYWITNTNNTNAAAKLYTFDANGIITDTIEFIDPEAEVKNGVVDVDGTLYYYENGSIKYGAGLIDYEDGMIYVRSNGQLAIGKYWVTNHNDKAEAGYYTFGTDGMMIVD